MKTFAHAFMLFSLATPAIAADFTAADALFANRDGSVENTKAARAAYQQIVAQGAKETDLVRAVEGIARTYLYEGEVLIPKTTDAEKKARKAVFNECRTRVVEPISPQNLGFVSPVYYYFRATCLAHEAEVSSTVERLLNLPALLDTFKKGLEAPGGDILEGGGIKRVKAAIKGNVEAKGLPGGLYNPEEALALVDEAIEAEAYPGNAEGFLFCENYFRKATILQTLGRGSEAKALAEQTIVDFTGYLADGLIPEFIRAETSHCIGEVENLSATL